VTQGTIDITDHDLDADPVIFKGFFICYCGSYRQPRIKNDNPRRRFELS